MSRTALLRERAARHGVATRPADGVVAAARLTTAVQAQDAPAAQLGLRARAPGLTDAGVRQAVDERSVVRTWLLRGTIHLVAAEDLRWLVRLTGPTVARRYATRWRQLGLSDDVRDRVARALPEVLADGPRTRAEIFAELAGRGVGPAGDRTGELPGELHVHALVQASVTGLICRGPDRGRTSTFVLLDDWLPASPPGPDGDDALAELARRYFAAYSPATAADFAAWAGMGAGRALALVRDELTPVDVDGRPGFRLGEVAPQPGVRLLPAFDNYLIGYADRSAIIDDAHRGAVYQGGMIRPVVLVDGRVAGTWSLQRARRRLAVTAFAAFSARVRREVEREAADVARFLETPLTITVAP